MKPSVVVGGARVFLGDCREVLKTLPDNSVDSVVTDPPYELGFMGKSWDNSGIAYDVTVWVECLRVLKPGGHVLAFGGSRTWHRLAVAVEDAGFELRDSIAWIYGSGFPKSLDVSKAIDKRGGATANFAEFRDAVKIAMKENNVSRSELQDALGNFMLSHYLTAGSQPAIPNWTDYQVIRDKVGLGSRFDELFLPEAEREVIGMGAAQCSQLEKSGVCDGHFDNGTLQVKHQLATKSATPEAQKWQGWGTALKPAFEPVVVGRKPLVGTVAENVLAWGVGGLNIDGSRIGTGTGESRTVSYPDIRGDNYQQGKEAYSERGTVDRVVKDQGRWPANVVLDEFTAGLLDEQSGVGVSKRAERGAGKQETGVYGEWGTLDDTTRGHSDSGGASRFFYQAKASKRDRNEGLEDLESRAVEIGDERPSGSSWERRDERQTTPRQNFHPTVKPTQLMRYLIKLVTPEGGTVLDPFTGSGSTGKAALLDGYEFIGAELTEEYLPIIEGRLRWALEQEGEDDDTLF